ncbi:SDR family NAD(P)-dependent oxidoreductase [Erythrobacter sp.]|uniref:SDR family NAD(P)-dependent oxidoreductase n=1 Tax=Erythrobacter sp. TaxID=1042 RepID=UPI002E9E4FE5|nr:SDR family NAD(P)-dependent oxidoreductase [Erythrobacter sp.]
MSIDLPRIPNSRLNGRRALVTGAGRGIGLSCAAALAEAGAHVVLVARNHDEIEEVARTICERGESAEARVLDISDLAAVRTFFDEQDGFDILVNNAGTNRPKPMIEVKEDDYDAVLDLNVKSLFFVSQLCARRMIAEKRRGSLIHMSSQMGHVGGPDRSLYCASKWAVEGLNKALALDLAPHGIRSNTIAPTFIETPMTKPFFEDEAFKASVLEKIKLGRLGTVKDLMGAVVFLASDASAMMTGSSLVIDGGWTVD